MTRIEKLGQTNVNLEKYYPPLSSPGTPVAHGDATLASTIWVVPTGTRHPLQLQRTWGGSTWARRWREKTFKFMNRTCWSIKFIFKWCQLQNLASLRLVHGMLHGQVVCSTLCYLSFFKNEGWPNWPFNLYKATHNLKQFVVGSNLLKHLRVELPDSTVSVNRWNKFINMFWGKLYNVKVPGG